jgi:hypothetical protein
LPAGRFRNPVGGKAAFAHARETVLASGRVLGKKPLILNGLSKLLLALILDQA